MSRITAFIRDHTVVTQTPLLPEIHLHLATEVTPLWEATETVLTKTGLPPPYWAFAWVGGQALARHVLDHPELVRGRVVLDFASGSGLVAVACAIAGAASVTASDIDPFALAVIGLNAELNNVEIATIAGDLVNGPPGLWDVVLAGDICYERPMTAHVLPWLRALTASGVVVLLADPGRAYLPENGLQPLTRYHVPTSREIESQESRETIVYRLIG